MTRHRMGLSKCSRMLAALCVVGTLSATPVANGGVVPVSLGEVTTRARTANVERFRALVREELVALRHDENAQVRETYVLSASLVKLEGTRGDDEAVADCVVSATLRLRRGGAIVALLRGKGRVIDDAAELEAAKQDAMRAAVKSAMRRLPEALGTSCGDSPRAR
jgi:hypothetical protein